MIPGRSRTSALTRASRTRRDGVTPTSPLPAYDTGVKHRLRGSAAALLASALTVGLGCGVAPGAAVRPPSSAAHRSRVVVISIDGMMPDTWSAPDAQGLAVPTLRALAARGAKARVQTVFPAVTYPAHTTMVTGVAPAVHGIVTNRPPDPLNKNLAGWRWYSEEIRVPTLWQAVTAQQREVALIEWPVTLGARVSFVVPEYWRAGTSEDQRLMRALATPGLLPAVEADYPQLWSKLTPPDVEDAAQFAIARHLLARHDPDLMLVHVWRTDDMQHDHGPGSEQAKAAFEAVDRELGALLQQLEASPRWQDTTLVVVSDHGFAAVEREVRLNVLLRQRGLIVEDPVEHKVTSSRIAVVGNGGSAFVYAADAAAKEQALAAVRELGAPIASVMTGEEVAAQGGDASVSFAVMAAPGYQFTDSRLGEVVVQTPNKGAHGFAPTDPAMHASLLLVGPRIPAIDLGVVPMTSVAPTLAALLGTPLPSATGAPLSRILPAAGAAGAAR
jgi:predicted AlkP superfamily pyrophosphatase or phosphodiesterase